MDFVLPRINQWGHNRTIVGLKRNHRVRKQLSLLRHNRTIVGLKQKEGA